MDSNTPTENTSLKTHPVADQQVSQPDIDSQRSQKSTRWTLAIASLGLLFTLVAIGSVVRQAIVRPPAFSSSDTSRTGESLTEDSLAGTAQTAPAAEFSAETSSETPLRLVRSLNELSQVWSVATYVREDGHMMVVGGNAEGDIKIWDGPIGKLVRVLIGHTDVVRTVAVATSGERLVSGSGDGIKVWEPQAGELLYSLPAEAGSPVWTVAISPDERTFISGDYGGTITVWDMESGEALYRRYVGVPVWSIAIAPDGNSFVSGNDDGTIIQWNLDTGSIVKEFTGHRSTVRAVAITPDGKTLASGSWDSSIKLWNLDSGELENTLTEHRDRVVALAISPDGKTLASGSVDRTLKTWDLSTQQLVKTLDTNSNWVLTVAFDPVEQTLISGGKDQDVKVWQ
ncbi:MAG: WD40 repeat domain-containing protein [Phormidesmis sp.]